MRLSTLFFTWIAVSIGVVSCAPDGRDSTSPEAVGVFTSALTRTTWAFPCEDLSANGDANIKGQQRIWTFSSATSSKLVYHYYAESTCGTEIAHFDFLYNHSITAVQGDGYKINLSLIDYILTPLTTNVASDYNSRSVCGLSSGWFQFNPRGVTSLGCTPVLGQSFPFTSSGSIVYDIVHIDPEQSPNQLYLGDKTTGDTTSEDRRPTAFSTLGFVAQ